MGEGKQTTKGTSCKWKVETDQICSEMETTLMYVWIELEPIMNIQKLCDAGRDTRRNHGRATYF